MTEPKDPEQTLLFDSLGRKPQQRWIDAHQRRQDAKARFAALPGVERDAIWARVDRLLFVEAKWIRAKSPEYAANPHSYTRRKDWQDDADFVFLVQFIRSGVCDREKYPETGPAGRWYDVLNRLHPVSGVPCKVWPMNWPVSQTILLNRKPVFWDTDR